MNAPIFAPPKRSAGRRADGLPPHSEEAERGALGSLLLAPEEAAPRLAKLQRSDFYDLRHQEIYSACVCLLADGKPPHPLVLMQWLKDKGKLDGVGGMAYLSSLEEATPCAEMFEMFLDVIKEKATRRAALALSARISQLAVDERIEPGALVHDTQRLCGEVFKDAAAAREWFRFYAPSECRNYAPPQGLVLAGDCHVTRGALTVIAGPPGVGKSRAALALAVCGANSQPWFGLPIHRPFRTAILQNENGLHRLKAEFADVRAENLDDFLRVTDPPPFGMAFDNGDFRTRLGQWLEEWKPDVVVFDPWNSAARDDGQRDYLTLLNALKEALPKRDSAPALVIVAHTRKPRSGDERRSGRGLLNDVAGSHVLVSVPRCVFVMQHASDDPEDDRIVWTCCKNNDGPLGPRTAWHRRNGLFAPCDEFDWDQFEEPDPNIRGSIRKSHLEKLFADGRMIALKLAVRELQEMTGLSKTPCYEALSREGSFSEHLYETPDGLLAWRP